MFFCLQCALGYQIFPQFDLVKWGGEKRTLIDVSFFVHSMKHAQIDKKLSAIKWHRNCEVSLDQSDKMYVGSYTNQVRKFQNQDMKLSHYPKYEQIFFFHSYDDDFIFTFWNFLSFRLVMWPIQYSLKIPNLSETHLLTKNRATSTDSWENVML